MKLHLELAVDTAVEASANVLDIAAMFGLGVDRQRRIQILPAFDLEIEPGQVVFLTGPSGSGKSTILRLMQDQLAIQPEVRTVRFDAMAMPEERPLVDCFPGLELGRVCSILALAGLNDAFVMLRKPRELSDGQRYRLRLAQVMAEVEKTSVGRGDESGLRCDLAVNPAHREENSGERVGGAVMGAVGEAVKWTVVLADEFGATLDRLTAKVLARNARKWTRRRGDVTFVAATTHDDLLEALEPDVLIEKPLGEAVHVLYRRDRRQEAEHGGGSEAGGAVLGGAEMGNGTGTASGGGKSGGLCAIGRAPLQGASAGDSEAGAGAAV